MRRFLLLHGFSGVGKSWREFEALLPPDALILAPDLGGHGLPSAPFVSVADQSGFESEIARVRTLLAEADERSKGQGDPWEIVGYSLGGRIALGLVVSDARDGKTSEEESDGTAIGSRPHIGRATLVGVNPGLINEEARASRRQRDEEWALMLEGEGVEAFLSAWRAQPLFASQRGLSSETIALQREISLNNDAQGLAAAMRCLSLGRMPNYLKDLDSITVPTTWVAGADDGKFTELARHCARVAGGEFVSVEAVGHNVLLEAPQRLASIVLGGVR